MAGRPCNVSDLHAIEQAIMNGTLNAAELVDELIYRSYRWQRIYSPEIPACKWAPLFPQWEAFEARYQLDLPLRTRYAVGGAL